MRRRLIATLALGALVTGCATPKGLHDAQVTAIGPTLITGMTQIHDKAIDAPDIDRLFAAGLVHLSTIDPDIRVDVTTDDINLLLGEVTVARINRPHTQDISGWTGATQDVVAAGRQMSPLLANATSETILSALFEGVMPLLDPYSRYAGRRDAFRNRIARNGFVGLGLELEPVPRGAFVRATIKDGPADSAGVVPGDIIARVDGAKLTDQPLQVMLRRLDGPRDSLVKLAVERDGASLTFTARRALIIPETVKSDVSDGVLDLVVKSFNQRTAASIAEKLAAAGPVRGVILDMRGDPGGLLDQAVAVADLFLDKGVIATLRGRHPGAMQFYAATPGDAVSGAPIVMLLDGRSASAAEILAAALQENGRALAVGTASVGKGTVQTIVALPNGGELALSWARVFTPAGTVLAGRGILPDVCTLASVDAPPADAAEVIAAVLKAGPRPRLDIEAARVACRPEVHADRAVDVDVARRLLTDATLRAALQRPETGQFATSH